MKIAEVKAFALSFKLENAPRRGTGQPIKKDMVVVRVRTTDGITGYGESTTRSRPRSSPTSSITISHRSSSAPTRWKSRISGRRSTPSRRRPMGPAGLSTKRSVASTWHYGTCAVSVRTAGLPAARRLAQEDPCLCRRRMSRLPAATQAARGSAELRGQRLYRPQAAPGRQCRARRRARASCACCARRQNRHHG